MDGDNQLVDSRSGKAVQFTGDDPVKTNVGKFQTTRAIQYQSVAPIPLTSRNELLSFIVRELGQMPLVADTSFLLKTAS